MIEFFEIISIAAPHIYRSAFPLSPRESMVRNVHKSYIQPSPRVVHGLSISWALSVAIARHSNFVEQVAWSSCSRFIAVGLWEAIEIRDAATFERLHTFTHPETDKFRWLSFSADSRSLTWFSSDDGLTTLDLQTGGQISAIPSTPNPFTPLYFSSAYSMDGKMVGVAYRDLNNPGVKFISTYNLPSGTRSEEHTSELQSRP